MLWLLRAGARGVNARGGFGGFRPPEDTGRSRRAERRREVRARGRERRRVLRELVSTYPVGVRNAVRRAGGMLPDEGQGNVLRLTKWGKNHVERGVGGHLTMCGQRIDRPAVRPPDMSAGWCVDCTKIIDAVAAVHAARKQEG